MRIRLVRHATTVVIAGGSKILVDPMLSPAGAMAPVENSANRLRNPLVDLPAGAGDLIDADAVLLTHTHRDHFDGEAARLLPRGRLLICQPEDEEKLLGMGFYKVIPVQTSFCWKGITFTRTGGRHGTGEIGKMMGPVSGFVLETVNEPRLYIAGDTVWCPEVESALDSFQPEITVVYSGAARFTTGDPITMTAEDIIRVCLENKDTRVLAVHLEAFNHCGLTREELGRRLEEEGLSGRVTIPADGEWTDFSGSL